MDYTLNDQEHAILIDLRDNGAESEARRAAIILLSASGGSTSTIAEAVGLSAGQVRHWRREWRARRLGIFPDLDLDQDTAEPESPPDTVAVEVSGEPPPEDDATGDESDDSEPETPELIPGVDVPRLPLELRDSVGMAHEDPIAEAGRKALLFHFERMLRHEPGSRLGEDIEEVHDMRVATRRMRSAFRIMAPYFKKKATQPYRDALREVARVLGAVRDLDVLIDKAQRFAKSQAVRDLDPLLQAWYLERRDARMILIAHLDSKDFRRFVKDFHRFLTTPGKGVKASAEPPEDANTLIAYQVRHVVPQLIYARFERVRAYETVLEGAPVSTLHALRIDIKRLRYAVEFFVDVLGPEAKRVIEACKIMQDHLGDLNDADITIDRLTAFVEAHNAQFSGIPKFIRPDISGVEAYLVALHAERQHLLDTFPEAWAAFNSEAFRRDLGLAVAGL